MLDYYFSSNKSRTFFLLVTLVVVICSFYGRVNDFNYALWSIDYYFGFVRRGLGGEVLGFVFPEPYSQETLKLSFSLMFLVFCSGVLYFFSRNRVFSVSALAVVVCSGFFFQQFGYDQGKFDIYIVFLLMASLLSVDPVRPLFSFVLVSVFTGVALLIHEASAFIMVPGVMAALLIQSAEVKKNLVVVVAYWFVSVVLFSIIYLFGAESVSFDVRFDRSHSLMPFLRDDNDVFKIAGRSMQDNISMTLLKWQDGRVVSRMLLNLVASLPFIAMLYLVVKQMWRVSRLSVFGLMLVVFSVLPLHLLGIDFYRWNALMFTLAFIYVAYAGRVNSVFYQFPAWLLVTALIFSLWSGPFGVSTSLPVRGFLLSFFARFLPGPLMLPAYRGFNR